MQIKGNTALNLLDDDFLRDFIEITDNEDIEIIQALFESKLQQATYNPKYLADTMYHIEKIHSKNQGFILFLKDDFQQYPYFIKYEDLNENKVEKLLKAGYTHITQSTFVGTRRLSDLAFSNNAMIIDLDFYKVKEYEKLTPEQMYQVIKEDVFFKQYPPNYVFSSGNGLNLVYLLKENIALYKKQNNHKLRRILFQDIAQGFEKYGSDKQTADITRFNKMPGVLNYKNNKQVMIIEKLETEEYDLNDLNKALKPEKISKKTISKKKKSNIEYIFNPYSLQYQRFKDIETLIELRNFDIDNRELTLFILSNFHLQAFQDKEKTLEYVEKANKKLKKPLSERELNSTIKRLKPKYNYKNESLIETLNITLEEQNHMKTIIDKDEKNRRRRETYKLNQKYTKKSPEENLKIQSKIEAKGKVETYYRAGLKPKEIIEKTGYSKSYVFNLLKEIKQGLNSK